MRYARSDLSARERLDERQRGLPFRKLRKDHTFKRAIVFRQDEIAEPFAHFPLDRRELAADVVHVAAARRELGLELRVMRAEAELHAAAGRERIPAPEQRVGLRDARPAGVETPP